MPSYLQIRTSTLRILIVGMSATPENVLGLFITGSFGNRANMHSVATPLLFFIRVAMMSTQEGWQRESTNTERGAAATGSKLHYTNRSMHESPDETSRLVVNRVAGRYCSRFRVCASLHIASAENTTAKAA